MKKRKKEKNDIEVFNEIMDKACSYICKNSRTARQDGSEKFAVLIARQHLEVVDNAIEVIEKILSGDLPGRFTSEVNEETQEYINTIGDMLDDLRLSLIYAFENHTLAIIGERTTVENDSFSISVGHESFNLKDALDIFYLGKGNHPQWKKAFVWLKYFSPYRSNAREAMTRALETSKEKGSSIVEALIASEKEIAKDGCWTLLPEDYKEFTYL